jgi:hypothetical protein
MKAYVTVMKEILYVILIEFGIPMKLVMLIQMCVTEAYIRFRKGKHLFDTFSIRNCLKKGDALSP